MRNLFLLLLAANLLFAGWQYFVRQDNEPGIERVSWSPESPPAREAAEPSQPAVEEPAAAAVTVPDEPAEAPQYAARCASVGPFETDAEARTEQGVLRGQGLEATGRSRNGQVFSGRWVYVDNIRNRAQSDTFLRRLQSGGLAEAYRIRDEDTGGYVISLGIFSTESGARTVSLQAESLGFEVAVENRYRDVPEYWLDVQLASADMEQQLMDGYGEQLVSLSPTTDCAL